MTNYWGGGGALLGGALFVGAWKRCLDRPTAGLGAALGLGAAILSQTRPLEGLLLAAPLSLIIALRLRQRAAAAGLAAAAVLAAAGAWTLLYDARVTGDACKLPYLVYEENYNPAPLFVWQSGLRRVPDPGVAEIRDLWRDWNLAQYERHRTPWGLKDALLEKLGDFDEAWLEPLPVKVFVALPLLGLCGATLGWLGAAWAAGSAVIFTLLFYFPHYSAPFGGIFFLLVAAGMRRCWDWTWRRRPVGRAAVAAAALWLVSYTVLFLGRKIENPRGAWSYFRREAVDRMRAMGGRHLVLVRYGKGATYHDDWVANEADIDAAPVVWAWSLSPAGDRELEDYYRDRFIWRLEVVPPTPVFKLEKKP
jgi:hypothetical protein